MRKRLTIIYPDRSQVVETHEGIDVDSDDADPEKIRAWVTILQKHVHGFLQSVPYFNQYDGKPCIAYVNEEGWIKGMPLNEKATALWRFLLGPGHEPSIFGPLVIEQDDD